MPNEVEGPGGMPERADEVDAKDMGEPNGAAMPSPFGRHPFQPPRCCAVAALPIVTLFERFGGKGCATEPAAGGRTPLRNDDRTTSSRSRFVSIARSLLSSASKSSSSTAAELGDGCGAWCAGPKWERGAAGSESIAEAEATAAVLPLGKGDAGQGSTAADIRRCGRALGPESAVCARAQVVAVPGVVALELRARAKSRRTSGGRRRRGRLARVRCAARPRDTSIQVLRNLVSRYALASIVARR